MAETFSPDQHLMKLKGKDYLEVKWRLVWMLQATNPRAGYLTIELEHDRQNGYARYAAIAWDGNDETWRTITLYGMTLQVCGRVGTGIKTETRADFQDFAEKAETGALGRALAGIGFGTQFSPDVEEGHRVADSPVQPRQPQRPPQQPQRSQPQPQRPPLQPVKPQEGEQPASSEQMASIRKLCAALGREEPDPAQLTFTGAGALIRQLSRDYNARRQGGQSA